MPDLRQWLRTECGPITGTPKAVLMALHLFADAEGCCRPGVNAIAKAAGLDRATVLRSIPRLEACGALTVARAEGRPSTYTLTGKPVAWVDDDPSHSATRRTLRPVALCDPHPSHAATGTRRTLRPEVPVEVPSEVPLDPPTSLVSRARPDPREAREVVDTGEHFGDAPWGGSLGVDGDQGVKKCVDALSAKLGKEASMQDERRIASALAGGRMTPASLLEAIINSPFDAVNPLSWALKVAANGGVKARRTGPVVAHITEGSGGW